MARAVVVVVGDLVFTEGIFVSVVVLENCPIISADLTVTA